MSRPLITHPPCELPVVDGEWENYMDGTGWHRRKRKVILEGYVRTTDDYEGYTICFADSQEALSDPRLVRHKDVYTNLTNLLTPMESDPFFERYEERVRITMEIV